MFTTLRNSAGQTATVTVTDGGSVRAEIAGRKVTVSISNPAYAAGSRMSAIVAAIDPFNRTVDALEADGWWVA